MLLFKANMVVTENVGREVKIKNRLYSVYRVEVAALNMLTYIDVRKRVAVGDCIMSEQVYLTNDRDTLYYVEMVLCVGQFHIVPKEDFIPMEFLEVYVKGRFIRTDKAVLKKVGKANKFFLATTLAVRNESGMYFNLLLVSFHKKAEELNDVASNTFLKVKARLCHKVYQPGYELNLTHFDLVEEEKKGDN